GVTDAGKRGADTGVVGHVARVVLRHVEIDTDEYPLALQVEVCHSQEFHDRYSLREPGGRRCALTRAANDATDPPWAGPKGDCSQCRPQWQRRAEDGAVNMRRNEWMLPEATSRSSTRPSRPAYDS